MRKLASFDAAIWIAVLVLVAASAAFFATWGYPMEDAAMVFNYSEKIAAGDGVVYITGGEKVDGASDLLLTFALAGLVWLGIPVQVGAAMLNGVALGVIVVLIFLSWNQPKIGRWPAITAVCLFLTTTPVLFLGASGFGTLVFAAMVAISAFLAQHTDDASSFQSLILLGLSVALAGMNRIEGFILAGLIVLARAVGAKSLRIIAIPMGTTLAIAVAWFSWRWSYFGYPLPNSFYKKSGIYLGSVPIALRAVFEYTAPWIPLLFVGMLVERTRRRTFSYILLVIGPWAGIWVLLSNEMNHANRFQFPISPAVAIFCGSLILPMAPYFRSLQLRFRSMDARRISVFPLAALGVISLVVLPIFLTARRQVTRLTALHTVTFPQEVADGIRQASHGSELVVTTEAGMIAWRSGLPVVDLWGLNDKRIAHRGLLSPNEIAELRPQILYAHLGEIETLATPAARVKDRSWQRMNINLFCFAQRNGFAPAAIWREEADDWWVVLAKSDTPLLERLRKEFSTVRFHGYNPSFNVPIPTVHDCPPKDQFG